MTRQVRCCNLYCCTQTDPATLSDRLPKCEKNIGRRSRISDRLRKPGSYVLREIRVRKKSLKILTTFRKTAEGGLNPPVLHVGNVTRENVEQRQTFTTRGKLICPVNISVMLCAHRFLRLLANSFFETLQQNRLPHDCS